LNLPVPAYRETTGGEEKKTWKLFFSRGLELESLLADVLDGDLEDGFEVGVVLLGLLQVFDNHLDVFLD